jgi:signal transduction histidine kinase
MRMFSLVRRLSGPMVAAAVMAVLLGVMAVLQYRWVGQLSADERDRTTAHLQRRADAFADDFNRELTRAFFWLQVGPEIRRDRPVESDEERFERWYTTAPRPDLIKSIYRLKLDPDERHEDAVHLEIFERGPARLDRAEWPAALAPIRARLEEGMAEHRADSSRPVRVPLVWSDIPAIVIPRVQVQDRGQLRVAMPGTGYTIALLDEGVIVRELIPMLAERHFGQGQDASVFAAVVGPRGPIYTAPEGRVPDALLAKPDAKFDLFEIRFGEFNRFVIERRADGTMSSSSVQTRGAIRFTEERRGGPFRGSGAPPPPASWHVHLLHGAGSVDAAVAKARLRNLLVSFGVLLLLGASMGLVLVTTGRARRLAAQQMEFVAGVSHELRTPLAVIRSAAENLADGVVSDPRQVRRYGEVIAGEGRRLTQMVEQIMEFAGFASGRSTLDVRPADVGSILEDAARGAAPHLREHAAEIAQDVPASLPLVLADPAAVSRSLQNLIVNALKYGGSPPDVRVVVTTAPGGPRGEVRITVSDNGAGIAARDLPHIFEPFYRGADATARQIHGSGLGLSLVKRIMEDIGGRVSVRTEAGKGSAFTLHLPVAPEAQTADTALVRATNDELRTTS